MGTTREDLSQWFDEGLRQKATHMIVVCDTFDYGDYPVYVKADENVREVEVNIRNKGMTRIMEVYSLAMDKNKQLGQHRAWNY